METTIETVDLANLALAFIPVMGVLLIYYRWSLNYGNATYAVARMLVQLLTVGYCLVPALHRAPFGSAGGVTTDDCSVQLDCT